MEQEKKELEEAKKQAKQSSIFGFLDNFTGKNKDEHQGSIEFSLAGLFRCMCCVSPKPSQHQELTRIADTLGGVKRRLESIERYENDIVCRSPFCLANSIAIQLLQDR